MFAITSGIIRAISISYVRLQIFLFVLGFLFTIIMPAITNLLNRLFILTRDEHQNIWGLSGIIGSFILLVTYVNYTKEKTTLLGKLYAISLTSILIILQFVNYYELKNNVKLFDSLYTEKSFRIINNIDYRPQELEFIYKVESNLDIIPLYNRSEINFPIKEMLNEVALMDFIFHYTKGNNYIEHPYISGYISLIKEIEKNNPDKSRQEIVNILYSYHRKIQLLRSKIESISDTHFEEKYKTGILQKYFDDPVYKHFLKTDITDKKIILQNIPILYKFKEKVFKYFPIDEKNFWSSTYTIFYIPEKNNLYIVIYQYFMCRLFIAEVANILFFIIIISSFLILIGYPIFFLVSVLNPLKKLIYGLQKVDEGNLSISISIDVNDELGYVTRSFNKMVDSIRIKNRELEEYANKLEEKVKERTKELENSLKEIEKLKEKQDGDYFLTSLLLKPLNINEINADPIVNVNIVLNQFKKFYFRHWHSEIGGDFCSAYQINLRKKDFIFCVNADAMGKSIQGAGGALVLGSVLESIVERTRYEETVRDLYPEMWLKNTFVELHRVFESFDGSMLVSCILLLLDKKNGCIYHLNAEHPYLVLYRNNKASFLEPEKGLMKLGVSVGGLIQIQVDKLRIGDILIMGSDGKDDLVLEEKDGRRILNDDETLFLKVVEESQGNLELIYNNLSERGEFMDDLSMISIEYKGDMEWLKKTRYISKSDKLIYNDILKEIKVKNYNNVQKDLEILSKKYEYNGLVKKQLALLKLEQKQYKEAIQELEKSFEYMPWNSNILKILSKVHYKVKNYEKARIYGELYIIRRSNDKEMINFLIKIYEVLKNHTNFSELATNKIEKYKRFINI